MPEFDILKACVQQQFFALDPLDFATVWTCLVWEKHGKKASSLASENMVKANGFHLNPLILALYWIELEIEAQGRQEEWEH